MKKLLTALLITLVGVSVQAQNKPLACQEDASAGLKWENGRWTTKTFISENKFILVQRKGGLTADSVAKALSMDFPDQVSCINNLPSNISCQDVTGGNLYFDPRTLKGGISQILGSASNGTRRDTVTVQVFSCTPF